MSTDSAARFAAAAATLKALLIDANRPRPERLIALDEGADLLLQTLEEELPDAGAVETPAIVWSREAGEAEALFERAILISAGDSPGTAAILSSTPAIGPDGALLFVAPVAHGRHGAAQALLALARQGLLPEIGVGGVSGEAGAAMGHYLLRRKDFLVRLAAPDDLAALERLEELCWSATTRMAPPTLRARLRSHPGGQCVIEKEGEVVAAVYSQRIEAADVHGETAVTVHRLHRPDAPLVQLLALNVAPEFQDRSYGDILLEFMLEYSAATPGVTGVVGVTRCKDYGKKPELSPADYVALRNEHGRRFDPVLRFHELHGAEIVGVVENYRPDDDVNRGCGVLVRYDLRRRRRNEAAVAAVGAAGIERDAEGFIRRAVAEIVGQEPDALPLAAPLFELGLDSADLLDLNERIRTEFGARLEPAFFFEHNTCGRIIAHLERSAVEARDAGARTESAAPAISSTPQSPRAEDIAIVGLACALPGGVSDPEAFWRLLSEGRQAVGPLPEDRWSWPQGFDPAAHPGISLGGFLDDVASFDPQFFRISPHEAAAMDPQQRLLLQVSWACLEDAGWRPSALAGSDTAVFVGASGSDYHLRLCEQPLDEIAGHFGIGTSMAVLANRLSYFYDFVGPSLQIDTACSSSLVAVHEAVQALRSGLCGRALVAGVNILCHPANSIAFYRAGMLSKRGRCGTFDKSADGYVRGEGVVAVLLRPMADALRDGDRIHAVIKGSATNHGGLAAGLTVPNPAKQTELIQSALKSAGVGADTITYVEAHGTGTPLGDPVEVRGLKEAFGPGREAPACPIGSVKTNVGHLEAAAGLAGLLKTVLALREGAIPPTLNFAELNPHLSFEGSPFRVAARLQAWERPEGAPRRAGVSSFGSGGANAHVIVEEHRDAAEPSPAQPQTVIVPLSARSEDRLKARAQDLLAALESGRISDRDLLDLSYTLQLGREPMIARLALVVGSVGALRQGLRTHLSGGSSSALYRGQAGRGEAASPMKRLDELAARGEWDAIARAWVGGADLDWTELHVGRRPRLLGLPSYPFAKERFWLRDRKQPAAPSRSGGASAPERGQAGDDVFLQVREQVAAVLELAPERLETDVPLRTYGLDSIGGMRLQQALEAKLGAVVSGLDILENADLAALAAHVATVLRKPASDPRLAEQPARASEPRALSEGQKGLWALQQSAPGMSAYNLPFGLRVRASIDPDRLEAAIRSAADLHPVLGERVVETVEGPRRTAGGAIRVIREALPPQDATFEDLRRLARRPFVLAEEAPIRAHLLQGADEALILIVVHHIAFDAGSIKPAMSAIIDAYLGQETATPTDSISFDEFVAWEAEIVSGPAGEAARAHFAAHLAEAPPHVDLPLDRPRPADRSFASETVVKLLGDDAAERLRRFCRVQGATPASLLLTAFATALARYAAQDDIVVGVAASVRRKAEFEPLVGYMVNMVPVRVRLDESKPWAVTVHAVQRELVGSLDHAAYPFAAIVRDLGAPRSAERSPVFQVAFNYQNYFGGDALSELERGYAERLPFTFEAQLRQEGEYELELEVVETGPSFSLYLKYDAALFERETIERLAGHILVLAEAAADHPHATLRATSMLTPEEERLHLRTWNDTAEDLPADRPVDALVSAQAERSPDAVAYEFAGARLSYRELEQRAARLASRLQRRGCRTGDLVGVALRRSLDLPVALLAVLKAGAAYVPLEPDLPPARLAQMSRGAGLRFIVTEEATEARLAPASGPGVELIRIEDDGADADAPALAAPPNGADGRDRLAYVIYTSGSTGQPKGVMIGHAALANVLQALARRPGLAAGDRLFALTTYGFDIAGFELLGPLLVGATCTICPADDLRDPERLRAAIEAARPTVVQATPATWSMLLDAGWKPGPEVRLLCGGEPLPESLRDRFLALGCEAWNLYGPTEATIWATAQRIGPDEPTGVGRPLANVRAFVVDAAFRPAPIGAPGELCLAGVCLSDGYLGQPELTAERFVDNPFEPGGRMYRTGDRARWLPDGTLDVLGRNDQQVKLHGHRIELGDIEANLAGHPAVREAIVVAAAGGERRFLAAFYTIAKGAEAPGERELRDHLRALMPAYMLPSTFSQLDTLPLTPNGKVDRDALARRAAEARSPKTHSVSATELELRIAAIWREALGRAEIGRDDGFFDVGGDSTLAVTVARRIAEATGRPFSVTALFRRPTIAAIAAHLTPEAPAPAGPTPEAPEPKRSDRKPKIDAATQAEPPTPGAGPDGGGLAIVGISCHFPDAEGVERFWQNLVQGRDGVRRPTPEELLARGVPARTVEDPRFVAAQATIDGKDLFDPAFFKISPRDAERMHPQLRLLLTHSWSAVEDAGYAADDIPDTAVFMSASGTPYGSSSGAGGPDEPRILTEFGPYQEWLLAQGGTIPTIVSHRLGLRGPSYLVHSNCSSSLVALSLASEALDRGDVRQALVGAACLLPQWSTGYLHQDGLNFSSDGRVKAFDAEADGMIGGEGVAVVMVKRASDAIKDGDQIYALIRSVAVNNDGAEKAGFYAPSVRGQAEVIGRALERAGVTADSISYVEAHGTGTALGDPIEFAALDEAFRAQTTEVGFCGLGSVKSNIGHLDTAAGLAGIIKTALALEHGVIPPTAHFSAISPRIPIEGSPFFIAEAARPFPEGAPPRAAVSSFGIGGTNAHAILEQAPRAALRPESEARPQLFTVSARDAERLGEYVRQLLRAVETASDADLADIAFTLQVGRRAMEVRLAVVASTKAELIERLRAWSEGKAAEGVFAGTTGSGERSLASIAGDEDFAHTLARWFERERLPQLAELWVSGHALDWRRLPRASAPRRRRLPTYPFARERYWTQSAERYSAPPLAALQNALHPLLHENASDLWSQRFSSRFTGREFFLADHVVKDEPVLPGVAHLEIARAAAERSFADPDAAIRLADVVWLRPVTAKGGVSLIVELELEDDERVSWSIRADPASEEAPFSRGRATLERSAEPPRLDVDALRRRCVTAVSSEQCYAHFGRLGFAYGPAQQALVALMLGADPGGGAEVLAEIALPTAAAGDGFGLHPSILDAALQARIGLDPALTGGEGGAAASMPFALDDVQIYGASPTEGVVWVRASAGESGAMAKLDIDLADREGNVRVALRGFASRPITEPAVEGTLLARREWTDAPASAGPAAELEDHVIVLCASLERARPLETALWEEIPSARVVIAPHEASSAAAGYIAAAAELLVELKSLIADRPQRDVLVQVAIWDDGDWMLFEGLSGLLATAGMEQPRLRGQVSSFAAGASAVEVAAGLRQDAASPHQALMRRIGGARRVAEWREISASADAGTPPWRDGGVYLVTGGFGGLGLLFAEEIARRANAVTLVLAGRSAPSAEAKRRIAALEAGGAKVIGRALDVSDAAAVKALIEEVTAAVGPLTGVLHAAGVLRDGLIARKSVIELEEVMAAKVKGAANLDEATATQPLELFVLFASGSGALGNVGQSDYAAANAFLDAFASRRNSRVASGQRRGRTIAVDWPLWAEGGMRVDASSDRMRRERGAVPLSTEAGLRAFEAALASSEDQILVLSGDLRRLRNDIAPPAAQPETAAPAVSAPFPSGAPEREGLRDEAAAFLKKRLAAVVKLPPSRIDTDAELERYGIDSVMAIELTTALEGPFGPLSKTLFFERRTVGELADYFLATHRETLVELLGAPVGQAVAPTPPAAPPAIRSPGASAPRQQKGRLASSPRPAQARSAGEPLDVAIIGLAGRYPRARNVAEFWENLKAGRDCITEIPATRWDHSRYFDADKSKPGKTYGKWGGFIDGVDECDPLFFNISPREMEAIDPQERLFLQCVYEAVEDAGYTRDTLAADREGGGNVGVYVGVMYEEYQLYGAQAQLRGAPITLTGSPASIANRVSYFFNFNGPSVAVDTMCSSSLTAVHLACRDLAYGCDYAIAGGVNVSVHPNKYLFLGQFGFISSQGRCASFGQGGDGYVPGEGVGAVLLKPLSRAVADGDRIYGVIRGTAVNHGGKTNGYTVPNPQAQGRVIERALRESGVDARAVSYVEAHGTGTSLGDPIEIAGLSRAFAAFTPERGFCAIGSAKSNIGHCESAAGIAGLTKVLLQLKHGQIAPSLHAETLNPHIDFDATPFVVQRALAEWRRPTIAAPGGAREHPRIAGISSFGAGGSNAHVVVEEYVAPPEARRRPAGPSVIVLSARTEEQLRARAADLLAAIRSGPLGDDDLADMAFTLQVGREALERRLALTASSMAQAADLLQRHLDGEAEIDGLWRGEGRREREGALGLLGDEDLSGVVERWLARGQLGRLAEAWTKGVAIDWRRLHADATPRRLQLPTYPFARNRLWPAEAHDRMSGGPDGAEHPLLHSNISDLFGQKFRTRFSGDEPFLAGHIVNGQKILPGVAHLEMARAALEKAVGLQPFEARLLDTVWLRPVAVQDQLEVQLHVEADEDGGLSWTLQGDGAASEEPQLYSSGRAELIEIGDAPRLDVAAIASRCAREIAVDDCYRRFLQLGLDYGPAMRGLVRLSIGEDEAGRRDVLAEVAQPDSGTRGCVLSPSVMDSALHATLALDPSFDRADSDGSAAVLPFAVEEVSVFAPTPARALVWARLAEGVSRSDPVVKVDLDVLDEDGRVCAALRGLAGRRAAGSALEVASPHEDPGAVLLTPSWEVDAPAFIEPWPAASDRVAILGSSVLGQALKMRLPDAATLACDPRLDVDALAARLGALGTLDHLIWAPPGAGAGAGATADPLVAGQESGALFGFRLLKALLALGYGERKLGLTVVTTQAAPIAPDESVDPTDASVHGFIGSAAKEYGPAWRMRVVDIPAGAPAPIDEILRLSADPDGETLAWREGRWLRRRLLPTRLPQPALSPYRDGGVYVVAGGAGGIGAAWTEHVIRKHAARVVWLGRRPEDETIRSRIGSLAELGPRPAYLQVDAADRDALAAVHETILRSHGPVSGVVHSALVLKDASLARMDEATFRAALAAKVDVSVNLASAFAGASLELMLFFSSMISFAKSPGQSNYAAGCVFADAFAHALRRSRGLNAKVMNWGWWGSVGVVATEAHRERMNRLGLGSVEPDEGMAALDVLLSGPVDQIAFLKTTRPLTTADGIADEMLLAAPQQAPSVIASLTHFEGRLHG